MKIFFFFFLMLYLSTVTKTWLGLTAAVILLFQLTVCFSCCIILNFKKKSSLSLDNLLWSAVLQFFSNKKTKKRELFQELLIWLLLWTTSRHAGLWKCLTANNSSKPLAKHAHLLGDVGTQVDRESQGWVCSLHKVSQLFTTRKLMTQKSTQKLPLLASKRDMFLQGYHINCVNEL